MSLHLTMWSSRISYSRRGLRACLRGGTNVGVAWLAVCSRRLVARCTSPRPSSPPAVWTSRPSAVITSGRLLLAFNGYLPVDLLHFYLLFALKYSPCIALHIVVHSTEPTLECCFITGWCVRRGGRRGFQEATASPRASQPLAWSTAAGCPPRCTSSFDCPFSIVARAPHLTLILWHYGHGPRSLSYGGRRRAAH